MTEFYLNIPNTTKGHVCVIGPTADGMTPGRREGMAVSTYENQTGWQIISEKPTPVIVLK